MKKAILAALGIVAGGTVTTVGVMEYQARQPETTTVPVSWPANTGRGANTPLEYEWSLHGQRSVYVRGGWLRSQVWEKLGTGRTDASSNSTTVEVEMPRILDTLYLYTTYRTRTRKGWTGWSTVPGFLTLTAQADSIAMYQVMPGLMRRVDTTSIRMLKDSVAQLCLKMYAGDTLYATTCPDAPPAAPDTL